MGYPVEVDLHYRFWDRSRLLRTGIGRTLDISSGVIWFESEDALPLGRQVNLTIPWPALGQLAGALELHVLGRTVRRLRNRTAVQILRGDFRARPLQTQTVALPCSTAELVYCSAANWVRDGLPSDTETVVQAACTSGDVAIDLQIEPAFEAAEMTLVGQVVNRHSGEPLAGAPVRLLAGQKLLATNQTNSCGELCLVSSLQSGMNSCLEIDAVGLRVRVPLKKLTARFRI